MNNIVVLKPLAQPDLSNEVVQKLDLYDLAANAEGDFEVSLTVKGQTVKMNGEKHWEVSETRVVRRKIADKPKRGWPFGR